MAMRYFSRPTISPPALDTLRWAKDTFTSVRTSIDRTISPSISKEELKDVKKYLSGTEKMQKFENVNDFLDDLHS